MKETTYLTALPNEAKVIFIDMGKLAYPNLATA